MARPGFSRVAARRSAQRTWPGDPPIFGHQFPQTRCCLDSARTGDVLCPARAVVAFRRDVAAGDLRSGLRCEVERGKVPGIGFSVEPRTLNRVTALTHAGGP